MNRDAERQIVEILARHGKVELGILFGSEASGRADRSSDVDIGFVLAQRESMSLGEQLDLAVEIERAVSREVDLVDLVAGSALLRSQAIRGRCLFERRPGAFAALLSRSLFEMDDLRPHLLRCGKRLLQSTGAA